MPAFFAPCAELVVRASGVTPGSRLLDVATGTGIVVRAFAPRVGPAGQLAGSDLNAGMLAAAEAVCRDLIPRPRWVQADAVRLPFADASFDAVCCQQGLQFFPDQDAALREMRRVLAPDGRLILAMWRAIEHNSIILPFAGALDDHVGTSAGDIMRGPFAGPPLADLRMLLEAAALPRVRVTIESIRVRFPTVDEFMQREVQSSPLAGPVAALVEDAREAFIADVHRLLAPWVDDAGFAFSMETWLVTAEAQAP